MKYWKPLLVAVLAVCAAFLHYTADAQDIERPAIIAVSHCGVTAGYIALPADGSTQFFSLYDATHDRDVNASLKALFDAGDAWEWAVEEFTGIACPLES